GWIGSLHIIQLLVRKSQLALHHTSIENNRDFPRLNSRNFIIWMTRVTAALDGKNLLGFVTRADYAGDSDPEFSDDDDLDPALFDENQAVSETLDEIGTPSADPSEGSSSSESSESNSTASDAGGDVEKTQGNLSVVKTLASTKQDEHKRVEKLKAKRNNAELKSTSPHGSKSEGVPDHKPSATNMCSWSRIRLLRLRFIRRSVASTNVLPYTVTRTTSSHTS
ncbi:hypothetical protein F442_07105, partial [Phytophthora nicotianae P10297]